jgi:hypothetical protein
MNLGIMQPYFFPYLGYFDLINRTDRWVVFDVVQFSRKSWMVRNRILHPGKGWQYIGVAVKKAERDALISDIVILDAETSLTRILGQLEHYKRSAPNYKAVVDLVRAGFMASAGNRLVDINVATLTSVCEYLGITFDWSICSEMDLDFDSISHPGQWALRVSEQLGATEYTNPPGGRDIFKVEEWYEAEITLQFTEIPNFQYETKPHEFVPNLSIIDLLMWNPPEAIFDYLQRMKVEATREIEV